MGGRRCSPVSRCFGVISGTIVFNDAHVLGRQASDIGHELSHGLLPQTPETVMDERGCRYRDREVEDEANWLSGARMVPEEAALSIIRRGWSLEVAAAHYGCNAKDGPISH